MHESVPCMRPRLLTPSRFALRWTRRLALVLAAAALAVATGFGLYALLLLPPLDAWHTEILDGEYRATVHADLDFAGYQALEAALFSRTAQAAAAFANEPRYAASRFDPSGAGQRLSGGAPFNRSYRLPPTARPLRGSALLLHGLTDSPYSVRALAETLQAQGFEVTALRLPGHGTLPSMLTRMRFADWHAAVRMAVRDVAARTPPGAAFYLGGYSTGGTLAFIHALEALDDATLRRPDRLLLIAPAIEVAPVAGLVNLLDLGAVLPVPALQKVKWQELAPEYDPYKFNSFPVNATRQVRRATLELQALFERAVQRGRLGELPPIIAWQSLVDSTLGSRALIERVFARLDRPVHELVLFDVNRVSGLEAVANDALRAQLAQVIAAPRRYRLTLVRNLDASTLEVRVTTLLPTDAVSAPKAGETPVPAAPALRWPSDVVSLGHVALPFRPDDPVYGHLPGSGANGLPSFGSLTLRGENGALVFPLGAFTRLRSNPFWPLIEQQIVQLVAQDLASSAVPVARTASAPGR